MANQRKKTKVNVGGFFDAQLNLAQAQLRELQSLVQIYRSLGGGWQP